HEAIAARYLQRNADLPVASAMESISDHGAAAKVFPTTQHPRFEMLTDVGQFTSACGLTFFRGAMFVAEPVHNLVHQDSLDAGGDLVRMAEESSSPVGRIHALWTLEGLHKLDPSLIEKALDDSEPGVRENAVILAESRLDALGPKLIDMASDPSPKVRFQL